MMSNKSLLLHKISLKNFKEHPSKYTALAVFLTARKCEIPIPEEVLQAITPIIENLYDEQRKLVPDQCARRNKKLNDNYLLLQCALEEENIDKACVRFRKEIDESIETSTLRKRLERFLASQIKNYIQNNISDPAAASQHYPFKDTNTEEMLEMYCQIMALENA